MVFMDYTNVKVGLRKEDLYEISNPDFLFFWGHHGKPGETTKACLSQWYPCMFTVNGIHYNCTEQFMMAENSTKGRGKNWTSPHQSNVSSAIYDNFALAGGLCQFGILMNPNGKSTEWVLSLPAIFINLWIMRI